MSAPALPPATLEAFRTDVRAGRSCLVLFDRPDGIAWLDILGPAGMRGSDPAFAAPVPTVRLWPAGGGAAPLAVAAANRAFPAELERVAERARLVVGEEWPLLLAVLATVREATEGMRFRVQSVGDTVTEVGSPSAHAWRSCLPLGDLQTAVLRAANLRAAA